METANTNPLLLCLASQKEREWVRVSAAHSQWKYFLSLCVAVFVCRTCVPIQHPASCLPGLKFGQLCLSCFSSWDAGAALASHDDYRIPGGVVSWSCEFSWSFHLYYPVWQIIWKHWFVCNRHGDTSACQLLGVGLTGSCHVMLKVRYVCGTCVNEQKEKAEAFMLSSCLTISLNKCSNQCLCLTGLDCTVCVSVPLCVPYSHSSLLV